MEDRESFKRAFGGHGFKTGFLKLTLLKLISNGPSHGYALMGDIERLTEKDWRPSPGSIYPALQELERKGLITSEKKGMQRTYTITPEGDKVLVQAISHLKIVMRHIMDLFPEDL